MTEDLILIGTVSAAQAIDGSFRVRTIGNPEGLLEIKRVQLQNQGWMSVKSARLHVGILVLRLAGITTPEAVETLHGLELRAEKSSVQLEPGTFFYHDLVGLPVRSPDGRDLGCVRDVIDAGAQDVLVIAYQGHDVLVPLQAPYVQIRAGVCEVEPLLGLFDD